MSTEDQERTEKVELLAKAYVKVPLGLLQGIFDLAVGSMDFGSGFWDDDDVRIGREVAELIGVDPIEGTPEPYRKRIAHTFKPHQFYGGRILCAHCHLEEGAEVHQPDAAPTP